MIELRIPSLDFSESDVTFTEWSVPDGAIVEEGQVIYCLEDEKAVREIESPVGGRLEHVAEVGGVYSAGILVARVHTT